jgi:hypothetical protein
MNPRDHVVSKVYMMFTSSLGMNGQQVSPTRMHQREYLIMMMMFGTMLVKPIRQFTI